MKKFTKTITNKTLFEYTRWILMALMLLVGTSSAWAWGWVVRCVDLQSSENPTYYLGDEATFYWCFNGDGSNATFKRACISTSSSSAGTWMDNLEWVKDGCDGNDNKTWKASFLLSSTGTKYYGLWLGWGNSVGDNGRYYNGSGTWYDGVTSYSGSMFTVNALPNPTNPEGSGAGTSATLSWTRNATYTTVMIVRYIKGATVTAPAQGTSYTAGTSKLGTGTVVYKGTESSFDDTGLTAGNSYTYYFYTLNNNYYSSGVSADISTCTPPDAPFEGVAQSEDICTGSTYTFNSDYKWYTSSDGSTTVSGSATINAETTYYIAKEGSDGCESPRTTYTINVNPIPSFSKNPTNKSICIGDSEDNLTTLSGVTVSNGSPVWYNAQTGGSKVNAADVVNGGTYWVAAENATTGCKNATRKQFVLTVNSRPVEPSFDAIAACGSYTLPTMDNQVNWYTAATDGEKITSVNTTGTYYAEAVDANNCTSTSRTAVQITINTIPTINISGSEEAVLYEDVELTAATDGTSISWEITEGDGSLSSTIGNFVTLTSSSTGNVTVTATATLGSCTATDTHEVEFSEEDCAPIPSNDIQITFNHPSSNTTDSKGQWWGMGTLYYSTNNSTWKSIDMGSSTSGSVTKTITNVTTNELYVYFESYWTYSHNTKAKTNTLTLDSGNKYDIKITRHGDDNTSATATATKTGSLTITAPAVKMVSAEYDEVNDKIVAKGAVYKTGCGVTFWGFQYSTDGQKWGTAETDYIRPNSGNSLTKAGEFEYSFAIPNAGGGDIYYIRAYALNNYNNDDYNLSSAVYSTTFLPVEIPSKTIESATISLVDSEGKPSDATVVCPQSTVYLKVSYVGGDFKSFEAADNFPGTDLELVNHDKVNNYAIFSFTATAAGTANITISNKSGSTVTPANGVSITLKDVQVVTPPIITINPESAMICQGDDATISIVEENQNYTYTIYKDGEALNPQSFTITEAGVYTVGATENECKTSATSMPIELKVVSSDVKIGLEADNTAIGPWQPLKLTVTPAKGYEYTLEGLDGMVYTKEGDVYTIKIPRPNDWSPGNSGTQLETENKVFTAKIKVSDEVSCGSKEVTVTLTDTEENCE